MNPHNATGTETSEPRRIPRRIYAIVAILALSLTITAAYGVYMTNMVVAGYVPFIDAAMEIRLAVSQAHGEHLALIAGESETTTENVVAFLDDAQWYARAILEGGVGEEGVFVAVRDPSIRSKARRVLADLDRLEENVSTPPANEADERAHLRLKEHNQLLSNIESMTREIEREAKNLVQRRYYQLRTLQIVLLLATVLIGLAVLFLLHAYGRRRTRELELSQKLNMDLAAANRQLQDNERQLRATNQQLGANEQQLRAANQQLRANEQQLRANEQQLRATNQQLQANEQQLRAANEQIRESEKKYRSFVENLPGITFQCDLDLVPLFMHGRVQAITGYSEEEFIRGEQRWDRMILPEDAERIRETAGDLREASHVSLEREYRIVTGNGDVRWVREAIQNVCDYEGRPKLIQGLIIDITKRRQAELALAAEQDRAREYLSIANVMMLALDSEGRVTMINRRGAEILGRREEEIIGVDWSATFIPERCRDSVEESFKRLVRGEMEPGGPHENPVLTASGEERLIGWYSTPLWDEKGAVIGTLSSGEDITERKRAESALATSERRFRSLVQNASDLTMVWRADGAITYVSPSSERLIGREPSELINQSITDLLEREDAENVQRVISGILAKPGRPAVLEWCWSHSDGSSLVFEALANNLLNDPDIGGIVVNARDITRRKNMERELKRRAEFEELTATISGGFVHIVGKEVEEAIDEALNRMGMFMDVDRMYVFVFQESDRIARNSNEWCAEGIPSQKGDLQDLNIEDYPWSLGRLRRGESLVINSVSQIPPEGEKDKGIFVEGGIESLLCIPMRAEGAVIGFVGCDCVENPRSWSEDEIRMVRVVAEVMANGLARKRAEEAVVRERDLVVRLADTTP
ncbi:MAG: PAS domain S-box protein, partial [Chitinivibrionales bacterium]|nr:PAS domain S-box protein [Chitinivibrionales bacterium]MBD3357579.1 PAS domain S-box protein [Chitinivibrionales bacterium]